MLRRRHLDGTVDRQLRIGFLDGFDRLFGDFCLEESERSECSPNVDSFKPCIIDVRSGKDQHLEMGKSKNLGGPRPCDSCFREVDFAEVGECCQGCQGFVRDLGIREFGFHKEGGGRSNHSNLGIINRLPPSEGLQGESLLWICREGYDPDAGLLGCFADGRHGLCRIREFWRLGT